MVRDINIPGNPFVGEKYSHLYTDVMFLIGNGASRKEFDLNRLVGKGTIFGCNALYRDFVPDILISVDSKMIQEILLTTYISDGNIVLVPGNRSNATGCFRYKPKQGFNTSGAYALHTIGEIFKPKRLYILGMDAYRGNVYTGSKNYINDLGNFNGFQRHYALGLESLKDTTVINVNSINAWGTQATNCTNYHVITYSDFEKVLDADKLLDCKII